MKLLLLIVVGLVATKVEQSEVLKNFTIGYTQFTADIYKELVKTVEGDILICPLSLDVILALANHAASGRTALQLSGRLHLPDDKEAAKQIFRELTGHLQGNDQYTLASANKIYLKDGFEIVEGFKDTAVDFFEADIHNIDFEKGEAAAAEMNKWIEEQTEDKIKNVISKHDLNNETRVLLVNAMYFHGKWITQFKEEDSRERTFHISNQEETKVNMMEVTEKFNYYENPELEAKFLELPYEGGEVTMTFVLPNDVEGLSALEARIADVLAAPEYKKEKVHVVIPKFKIESTIQFKPILQALGVEDAFEDYANFRGLSKIPTKISKIVQKNYIEVEEKGTTAAAATAVIQQLTRSRRPKKIPPKEFIADHPFVYYLRSPAGVMFIGRYVHL